MLKKGYQKQPLILYLYSAYSMNR